MQEIKIFKLNKADKPYQILMLNDGNSAQIFKIQLDRNLVLNKDQTQFDDLDELESILKKRLDLKGTLPVEIKSWCDQNEILKKNKDGQIEK